MDNIFSFLLGIAAIIALILFYAWMQTFTKAKEKEIKQDLARFGQCCGMESGVCTFKPKLDQLSKAEINLNAAKKEQ